MPIEYSSSPEYEKRQPAATTLTDAQAAELNDRQAFLLPDVNLGTISGDMRVEPRLEGSISVYSRLGGEMETTPRLSGRIRVRKL